MNKVFIVMLRSEFYGSEVIKKIFKTYKSAEIWVKKQCGIAGSMQYNKAKEAIEYDDHIEYVFNGWRILEYNVKD